MPEPMLSPGAIGGLSIGLIVVVAFLILFVIFCIHFRHYWFRRKHSKMPSHLNDNPPLGAHNQLYSADGDVQLKGTAEYWANLPYGNKTAYWFPAAQPQYYPTKPKADSIISAPIPPYPTGSWLTGLMGEPAVIATRQIASQPELSIAKHIQHKQHQAVPTSIGVYHMGDLSIPNPNASHLYCRFSEDITQFVEEPGTSTTDSSGNQPTQTTEKSAGRKLRSKMSKVARASLASQRLSRKVGSKKSRSKRKSRHAGFDSDQSVDPDVLGDDTFTFGAKVGDSITDQFGSLDNDAFLNTLELAAFQSVETPSLQRSPCEAPIGRVRFLTNYEQALDSGPYQLPIHDRASRLSYVTQFHPPHFTFRFPAPGPPVTGWAHHFGQPTSTPSPAVHQTPELEQPTGTKLGSKSDSVPLLPPPPSGHEHGVRRNCSVESSLNVVTRRRESKSPATPRLHSEPRKLPRDTNRSPTLQHEESRLNAVNTGSLSTLDSVIDSIVPTGVAKSPYAIELSPDSGFQDTSTIQTSLDGSGRSDGTADATLLSPTSLQSMDNGGLGEPDKLTNKVCASPKPRLITLCNRQ